MLWHVRADPAGKRLLVDLACSDAANHDHRLGLACDELDIVETEKRDDRKEGSALVPIDEGMVSRQPEAIGRRQLSPIAVFVGPAIARPPKRGLQRTNVSHAGRPSKLAQLSLV